MMSIAVSVQVQPSRFFSLLTVGMAVLLLLTGLLVISGYAGSFGFWGRISVLVTSLISSLFFIFLHFHSKKTFRIDISGSGQIRLREDTHNVSTQIFHQKQAAPDAEAFYLVNGSTIWPTLLLLRLVSDSARKSFLLVFPDSVNAEQFKALYIACQWLTVHQNETQ
ncbi:hypothetical protein NB640_02960 [Oxalobacter vibrioformis]|uniref:Uncharacterized protein n=1 Tax=Oxalobacter vibrioformis TaxID=933080 RepID=A0A9E9LXQ9_9BURK|nr:protein YgfX [Oxalobacter vibrioformis]WAW10637.1 hypothetical protein NB640_02960 [Oxalobacter vibrioformis]